MIKIFKSYHLKLFIFSSLFLMGTAFLVGISADQLSAQSLVQVSVTTSPTLPQPNEEVSIRARSFSTDFNKAQITWYLNGVLIKEGLGEDEFSFTLGDAGEIALVDVAIQTQEGRNIQRNVLINPAEVDLIWEAKNSSVPPFYQGKALFPREGELRVVAMPNVYNLNGEQVSSNNLVYRWRVNGQNRSSESGVGKNSLTLTGPRLDQPINVSVEVESLDESVRAKNDIRVRSSAQRALIYENHPDYGATLNRAIKESGFIGETITLTTFPLFFESKPRMTNLDFVWEVNNQRAVNLDGQREATFQRTNGALGGLSRVSTLITNRENSRHRAQENVELRLGQ